MFGWEVWGVRILGFLLVEHTDILVCIYVCILVDFELKEITADVDTISSIVIMTHW